MKHVLVPDFSRELKHSYKSFHKTEPKDNALYGSMNDSHFTCNSDDESDKEATIMCNIKCKETIYKTSQNNLRPHGKKKKRTTYVEEANF